MSLAAQIESVQPDVFYKICSEAFFDPVSVFNLREKRLDTQVNKALAGLGSVAAARARSGYSRPGTAAGATIEVLMPTLKGALEDTPGPVAALEQVLIIKEQPTINLGANGTGLTAEQIAINLVQTFQLFFLGGPMQGLYAGGAFYSAVDAGPESPFVMVKVTLSATFALTPVTRALAPAAAYAEGTLTLTDNQPGGGSDLYYTVDGSFPGPGNPAAVQYTVPVAIAANTAVRTAAYNGALQGSMVDNFTVS